MTEAVIIDKSLTKEEKYRTLIPQIESLIKDERDLMANLCNICAALKYSMDRFFWVGFYFKKGNELVLGPFQGPVACTRIRIPNGICGAAASRKETIIVENVNQFPGHIACSSASKSEIVVPIFKNDEVVAVLDVDSDSYSYFDETDSIYLGKIGSLVSQLMTV